jgi:hypothetical protein
MPGRSLIYAGGRPTWSEIVSVVEHVGGERWKDFARRHGDFGRGPALYLGRTPEQ